MKTSSKAVADVGGALSTTAAVTINYSQWKLLVDALAIAAVPCHYGLRGSSRRSVTGTGDCAQLDVIKTHCGSSPDQIVGWQSLWFIFGLFSHYPILVTRHGDRDLDAYNRGSDVCCPFCHCLVARLAPQVLVRNIASLNAAHRQVFNEACRPSVNRGLITCNYRHEIEKR